MAHSVPSLVMADSHYPSYVVMLKHETFPIANPQYKVHFQGVLYGYQELYWFKLFAKSINSAYTPLGYFEIGKFRLLLLTPFQTAVGGHFLNCFMMLIFVLGLLRFESA